jgi:hypothetical protein
LANFLGQLLIPALDFQSPGLSLATLLGFRLQDLFGLLQPYDGRNLSFSSEWSV